MQCVCSTSSLMTSTSGRAAAPLRRSPSRQRWQQPNLCGLSSALTSTSPRFSALRCSSLRHSWAAAGADILVTNTASQQCDAFEVEVNVRPSWGKILERDGNPSLLALDILLQDPDAGCAATCVASQRAHAVVRCYAAHCSVLAARHVLASDASETWLMRCKICLAAVQHTCGCCAHL